MSKFENSPNPEKDSLEQKRQRITGHLDTYINKRPEVLPRDEVEQAASALLEKVRALTGGEGELCFADEGRSLEVVVNSFPTGLPGESSVMNEEGSGVASVVIAQGAERQGPLADFRDAAYYVGIAADNYDIQTYAVLEERTLGGHPRNINRVAGLPEVQDIITVLEAIWE